MMHAAFFMQNENRSLLLTPKIDYQNPVLFRTFTFINLVNIIELRKKEEEGVSLGRLSTDMMLENF
jgi:hypothetical protein